MNKIARFFPAIVAGLLLGACSSGGSDSTDTGDGNTGTQLTLDGGLKGFSGGFVPAANSTWDLMAGAPGASGARGALLITRANETDFSSYILGENEGDYFGTSFKQLGDLVGNDKEHFAVGALYATGEAGISGAVYVYERNSDGSINKIAKLNGPMAMSKFGQALAVGDLNDDGHPDIVVAAPQAHATIGFQAGIVYVYFGGPSFDATPDVTIEGGVVAGNMGQAVATGDINGDGADDLFIADGPKKAYVYVYYGGAGFNPSAVDVTINGGGSGFGVSMAYLGDVNGDGRGDIAIGAPTRSTPAIYDNKGSVYIFSGWDPATVPGIVNENSAYRLLKISGSADADRFGSSIAWAGGTTKDILIGSRWQGGGTGSAPTGNVYRFSLADAAGVSTLPADPIADVWSITTETPVYPVAVTSGEYGGTLDVAPDGYFFAGAPRMDADNGRVYRRPLNSSSTGASGGTGGTTSDEYDCCT